MKHSLMSTGQTWKLPLRAPLFCSLLFACGCTGNTNGAAVYKDNEAATREHMQKVQDEEQAHFRNTAPQTPAAGRGK